jgi:hypothetical protein
MSYRLIAACIISTAQQANPKVRGHSDPALAQAIIEINLVEIHSSFTRLPVNPGSRVVQLDVDKFKPPPIVETAAHLYKGGDYFFFFFFFWRSCLAL